MQLAAGRGFLFEQPLGASTWSEEAMGPLYQHEDVYRIHCDMCRFGLRVPGTWNNGKQDSWPNQKPTGLLTNIPELQWYLEKRCMRDHAHGALVNGTAGPAQKYTGRFVSAVLRGLRSPEDRRFTPAAPRISTLRRRRRSGRRAAGRTRRSSTRTRVRHHPGELAGDRSHGGQSLNQSR